jgi:hypothetical protein
MCPYCLSGKKMFDFRNPLAMNEPGTLNPKPGTRNPKPVTFADLKHRPKNDPTGNRRLPAETD